MSWRGTVLLDAILDYEDSMSCTSDSSCDIGGILHMFDEPVPIFSVLGWSVEFIFHVSYGFDGIHLIEVMRIELGAG